MLRSFEESGRVVQSSLETLLPRIQNLRAMSEFETSKLLVVYPFVFSIDIHTYICVYLSLSYFLSLSMLIQDMRIYPFYKIRFLFLQRKLQVAQ